MQSLWLCLAEKSILTDTNIRSMKQYIAQKFPAYSSARRASILANTIHRHINEYLPLLDEAPKELLRIQLLQTAYSQNDFRIVSLDIFKACLELSLGKREIIEPLEQWLQLQGGDLTPEQMAPFTLLIQETIGLHYQNQSIHQSEHNPTTVYPSDHPNGYPNFFNDSLKRKIGLILLTLFLSITLGTKSILPNKSRLFNSYWNLPIMAAEEVMTKISIQRTHPNLLSNTLMQLYPITTANELTSRYIYAPVKKEALKQWLIERDSMLAEEPYLSTILATALQYNIHPFLLLAIAGQEQSLVPNSHKKATQIANNPFNVYHSWKDYNTDIEDSSRIAAQTILTLIKGRPEGTQPLEWINRKYAEDPKWHLGVEAFFNKMLSSVEKPS